MCECVETTFNIDNYNVFSGTTTKKEEFKHFRMKNRGEKIITKIN